MTKKRTPWQKALDYGRMYGVVNVGTVTGRRSRTDPEPQSIRDSQVPGRVRRRGQSEPLVVGYDLADLETRVAAHYSGRMTNYLAQSQIARRSWSIETSLYLAVAVALGVDVTVEY